MFLCSHMQVIWCSTTFKEPEEIRAMIVKGKLYRDVSWEEMWVLEEAEPRYIPVERPFQNPKKVNLATISHLGC